MEKAYFKFIGFLLLFASLGVIAIKSFFTLFGGGK